AGFQSRPVTDVFEGGALVAAEQEVHVLDRLAGPAFDEVVDGGEAGDGALAGVGRADGEADLDEVGAGDGNDLGQALPGAARERLARVALVEQGAEAAAVDVGGKLDEAGREDATGEGSGDRDEAELDRPCAGVAEGLDDLGDVLMLEGLVGLEVAGAA